MKNYSNLPGNLQNRVCKDILRPMAAQIFGHLYSAEIQRGNQWIDADDFIGKVARKSVLAASTICSELNKMYGSQFDDPMYEFKDEEIEEYKKYLHDQEI